MMVRDLKIAVQGLPDDAVVKFNGDEVLCFHSGNVPLTCRMGLHNWTRWSCEYGQPYFANNPDKCDGGAT